MFQVWPSQKLFESLVDEFYGRKGESNIIKNQKTTKNEPATIKYWRKSYEKDRKISFPQKASSPVLRPSGKPPSNPFLRLPGLRHLLGKQKSGNRGMKNRSLVVVPGFSEFSFGSSWWFLKRFDFACFEGKNLQSNLLWWFLICHCTGPHCQPNSQWPHYILVDSGKKVFMANQFDVESWRSSWFWTVSKVIFDAEAWMFWYEFRVSQQSSINRKDFACWMFTAMSQSPHVRLPLLLLYQHVFVPN